MQIRRIEVGNIGGLKDFDLELPTAEVSAIAGPNGTGKSKLLACILAPWTASIPQPRNPQDPAKVTLQVSLSAEEIGAIGRWGPARGWGENPPPPEKVVIHMSHNMGGFSFQCDPPVPALMHALRDVAFLKECPSMDMIYLPAERRLHAPDGGSVDLSQVTPDRSVGSTMQGRAQTQSGILDDNEFIAYARALCVAGSLPSEEAGQDGREIARSKWEEFKSSIDTLLYPKQLLPLTQQHPDQLRIGLPDGGFHSVQALSSGERQALIIVSRVFRAGDSHSLVAIDEPDAYLHPTLSSKLMRALSPGIGASGQILLATHSPSILDSVAPDAIIKLSHDDPPVALAGEEERITLYRAAGFRSSALTQADLLFVTEGDFDAEVLPQLIPLLGGAAVRAAGGRSMVFGTLKSLCGYDLPILGVVDADIQAEAPDISIASHCHIWEAADIEGVMLSDDGFLQYCIDGKLISARYRDLDSVKLALQGLQQGFRNASIAEMAMSKLRERANIRWPSPRVENAKDKAFEAFRAARSLNPDDFDIAWSEAEAVWNDDDLSKWKLVRGKWIIDKFAQMATGFKNGQAFIKVAVAQKPTITQVARLEGLIERVLQNRS